MIPNVSFYTSGNMDIFWDDVKKLLFATAPGLMIFIAMIAVGMLLTIVIRVFRTTAKHDEKDNDEIETRYY